MASLIEFIDEKYLINDTVKSLILTFAVIGVAAIISILIYSFNIDNIEDNKVWECYDKLEETELNGSEYDFLIGKNCYQRRDYIDVYANGNDSLLYWYRCKDDWNGRCMLMENYIEYTEGKHIFNGGFAMWEFE